MMACLWATALEVGGVSPPVWLLSRPLQGRELSLQLYLFLPAQRFEGVKARDRHDAALWEDAGLMAEASVTKGAGVGCAVLPFLGLACRRCLLALLCACRLTFRAANTTAVRVHFHAVGGAPIMKKNKFLVNGDDTFYAVRRDLRACVAGGAY